MTDLSPHNGTLSLRIRTARGVAYDDALAWQHDARAALRADPAEPDRLFLVEHDPVVTLGRSGDGSSLLRDADTLEQMGVACRETRRGGDVTWHGPGQWTLYPVLRLDRFCKDLHRYMRMLEETAIAFLKGAGVEGFRIPGRTGVWVAPQASGDPPAKIAAVGISVSNWISIHGMAVNIRSDLRAFREWMVPCGIAPDEGAVTSLAEVADTPPDMDTAAADLVRAFLSVFPHRAGEKG